MPEMTFAGGVRVMDEAGSSPGPRKPFFMFAAWFSLLAPLVAAGWAYSVGTTPHGADRPNPHISQGDSLALLAVFAVSFVAGCVSLRGIRSNGAWAILPPAVLGMLASAVFGVIALLYALL